MLSRLIEFSLTQRLIIVLLSLIVVGLGWRAWQETPIDAFPDVSTPQVKVIIKAKGMTPEEVESRITGPVEVEILGIPNMSVMRSTTKYALTDITVDFEEGTDIYWARNQVGERLSSIWGDLPQGVEGGVAPMTTPLGEMFMFTIDGDHLSLMERRELLDWVIRPALRGVEGVADVNALGGMVRSFEVIPSPARMAAVAITHQQLIEAIQTNNKNDGAGRIADGEEAILVRTDGSVTTIDDIKQIVVRAHLDEPLRVSDVAEVRFGALTRYGGVTRDGKGEAVQGLVLGLRGANAREVVAGVRARLDELKTSLPDGVSINVFYDRGQLVDRAVSTVMKALLEATVLVVVLLVLFLGDARAALTVSVVLPLSALITFILMRQFDLSANLMSLGGLAIAIGMLVDASIVVVENTTTWLKHEKTSGLPRLHLIYRAASEVAAPVTAGIGIIILVFLPLLSLQGLEGKLFSPVALTMVFALAGSLVLALTLMPVLASWLLKSTHGADPYLVRKVTKWYGPALEWFLAREKTVIRGGLALVVGAGLLFALIGKTFMPVMDEGDMIVQLEKLPSITLEQSLQQDLRFERAVIDQVPDVLGVVSRAGSDEIGLDPMSLNETDGFLILKPEEDWIAESKAEIEAHIRQVLEPFKGINFTFTQPIQMRVDEMLTGVRGDVAIKIFGAEPEQLNLAAAQIVDLVKDIEGAQDVYTPANEGAQYMQFKVNRLAAGRLGVSVNQLTDILRSQLEGVRIGTVYEGNKRIPILVRAEEGMRQSPLNLASLYLSLPDNRSVPISQVVDIIHTEGPVSINREGGARRAVVIANVDGRDLVSFVDEVRTQIANNVDLPTGYYVKYGGQFENQQRAAQRLMLVVPVALGLILLILFSTFGSMRQAILVLSNIPLALVGGIVSLFLSGSYLSVPASVGFIALLGIAVMNGVVMVSYFNTLRAQGMAMEQVIREGALRRLRPVLMTASITAFGLVPLLFADGPGSEIQKPLAIVVVGGVVSSTLLTLLALPVLYRRFGESPRKANKSGRMS